jgi:hypothetical protein
LEKAEKGLRSKEEEILVPSLLQKSDKGLKSREEERETRDEKSREIREGWVQRQEKRERRGTRG